MSHETLHPSRSKLFGGTHDVSTLVLVLFPFCCGLLVETLGRYIYIYICIYVSGRVGSGYHLGLRAANYIHRAGGSVWRVSLRMGCGIMSAWDEGTKREQGVSSKGNSWVHQNGHPHVAAICPERFAYEFYECTRRYRTPGTLQYVRVI